MARKISFSSEAVWYVPEIGDNRDDPEPMAVLVEPMSARELADHEGAMIREMSKPNKKQGFQVDYKAVERSMNRRVFESRVKQVRNYELKTPLGIVLKPTNGAELFDAIEQGPATERELMADIIEAVKDLSRLEAGNEKKFGSQSALSRAETSPSGPGVVASARENPTETSTEVVAHVTGSPTPTSLSHGLPSYEGAPGHN
jgi:hypothetical protein